MYSINPKVLEGILGKKFNSMVGNLCERLETFVHAQGVGIDSPAVRQLIKEVKKDSYNTMRDIAGQVEAFSNGVNVNVKIIRPDSK